MSVAYFPHLAPAESPIWERFLRLYGHLWDRFEYDQRVGGGREVDPKDSDATKAMWRALTRKRIDVVGWLGMQPTIFEISPRLGRTTIGALQAYYHLWVESHPGIVVPKLAAVGPRLDPDLARVMAAQGITVYLVPAPGTS